MPWLGVADRQQVCKVRPYAQKQQARRRAGARSGLEHAVLRSAGSYWPGRRAGGLTGVLVL